MDFDSFAKIIGAVGFLLPGFLILKIRQYVREFHREDAFSASITSLALSLFVAFIWLFLNFSWEAFKGAQSYPFQAALFQLIVENNLRLVFRPNVIIAFSSYLAVFIVILMGVFLWHWSLFGHYLISNLVGFRNKTAFLTPWEDLPSVSVGRWLAIETTDDYTYVGLIRTDAF